MNEFKTVIGQKIKLAKHDESTLTISLENNENHIFEAYGDCCSQSFIEDMDNLEALANATLISVDSVEGSHKDVGDEGEKLTVYCLSDEAFEYHYVNFNVIEIQGAA